MSISLATQTTQASASQANDTRLADYYTFVKEKARDDAVGHEALTVVAIGFVRAVYDGVVDPAKDKNGEDAAERTFKVYAAAKGKKAFHERSEGSAKAQISKFRQLQKAASKPANDFVDVTNRSVTIRQKAIDDGIEVKSSFPALVDLAREQLKYDDDLDDAMIFSVVTKTEQTKEVTLEGQLKKMHKIAEDIITGEKYPGVCDQSGEMHAIEELVRNKLNATVALREKSEAHDKAVTLGFVKNEDGSYSMPE